MGGGEEGKWVRAGRRAIVEMSTGCCMETNLTINYIKKQINFKCQSIHQIKFSRLYLNYYKIFVFGTTDRHFIWALYLQKLKKQKQKQKQKTSSRPPLHTVTPSEITHLFLHPFYLPSSPQPMDIGSRWAVESLWN